MSGDSRREVSQLTVSGLGSISQTSSINPTLDMSRTWFMVLSLVAWNWNVMSQSGVLRSYTNAPQFCQHSSLSSSFMIRTATSDSPRISVTGPPPQVGMGLKLNSFCSSLLLATAPRVLT